MVIAVACRTEDVVKACLRGINRKYTVVSVLAMSTPGNGSVTRAFDPEEIYPNSPLIEVVCEIRFPPDLSIDGRKHEFQQQIRDEYPNVWIPGRGDSETVLCRFEDTYRTAGVLIGLDRMARYEKKYTGHKNFIRHFFKVVDVFKTVYKIKNLTRLGWRYINIIPFVRSDGLVPLEDFLKIKILLGESCALPLRLDVTVESMAADGSLTTKLATLTQQGTGREVMVLDFDFSMTANLQVSKLRSHVRHAHSVTRATFETLITDQYREFLRGEAGE